MNYLTVKEVAELKGCSERYIKQLCKDGKIQTEQEINCKGRMKYLISVSALSEDLQAKYYKQKRTEAGIMPEKIEPENSSETAFKYHLKGVSKLYEEFSEAERTVIDFWIDLLKRWQAERSKYRNKTEFDKVFVANLKYNNYDNPKFRISTDILYRKYAAYKNECYADLIDNRGSWSRGKSTILAPVWDDFLWEWLDENQPTVSLCYRSTIQWTAEFYPELLELIPSESTFRRRIDRDVAVAVKTLMRDGEKAFNDRCAPYIMRMYNKLEANDCWIADTHTLYNPMIMKIRCIDFIRQLLLMQNQVF